MGNCFGKTNDNFRGDGQTLNASPVQATNPFTDPSSPSPPRISAPSGGKTLGRNPQAPEQSANPREAAARAAEERAKASQGGKGKLGKQLEAQRARTQAAMLASTARETVAARDADATVQARNYN